MLFDFPIHDEIFERLTNYDLCLKPRGIYKTKEMVPDNYLFPMYFFREDGIFVVSTSVYALIHYKKRFVRNPKFQTTFWYRPTFQTIDAEIHRARTIYRRSTNKLTDPVVIGNLGVQIIQEYITEIEGKFPDYTHVLLMGGKDSQNLLLANRKSSWIAVTGGPNTGINKDFIEKNGLAIEEYVAVSNDTIDSTLQDEIVASDCFFDVAHFRYGDTLKKIIESKNGKVVLWFGTSGDGCFKRNNLHRDKDYYATHDLHVGMSMGIWHQLYRNQFDVPCLSPYQAPKFLDKIFYQYDPYYVDKIKTDLRADMGEQLFGKKVWYPDSNPEPSPWVRDRSQSIPAYLKQLRKDGIECIEKPFQSTLIMNKEKLQLFWATHTEKKRTRLSRVLFPIRNKLACIFPAFTNNRHNLTAKEIG